jgi:hypothetical protein
VWSVEDETMIRGKTTFWLKWSGGHLTNLNFAAIQSAFVRDSAVAVSPHHQLITLTFTDKIPNLNNNVGKFRRVVVYPTRLDVGQSLIHYKSKGSVRSQDGIPLR